MVTNQTTPATPSAYQASGAAPESLRGRRAAVVLFSHYPDDPRPRRSAEALVELGMDVEVFCLKSDEGEQPSEVCGGVKVRRLSVKRKRGGKFSYVWEYSRFLLACCFLLGVRTLRQRYSLVHVHNMPDVLVFSALIPKVSGARVILDLHDPMPELMQTIFGMDPGSAGVRFLACLEKWSAGFADAVITVNQACKTLFTSRGCAPEKLRVVMNSPDEALFPYHAHSFSNPSARSGPAPFVIMYHGSLVERHGLDLAVAALGKVKEAIPGAELRIYGRATPFLEQVMHSARVAGLRDCVRYLGPKPLEEIARAIGECDLGIIPNRRSIFTEINTPTRIFEYLSQGKPVIAPRAAGILDYFGSDELVFFELGDAEDLAEKIVYVFKKPSEVARIIARGQRVYLAHRWSNERTGFVHLVQELLQGVNVRCGG